MRWPEHVVIAAAGAIVPDLFLVLFAWRRTWQAETSLLVRLHRSMHRPQTLLWWLVFGAISHIVIDLVSKHNDKRTAV